MDGDTASGQVKFQKTIGGSATDLSYELRQTTDGGYIIAGYTESFGFGSRDIYLVRTDSNGDTLWTRNYGGASEDYAWTVRQTIDGGFIVGAHSGSFGAGGHDVNLVKTDEEGTVLWTRIYGGSSADGAYAMQQTPDGGYIVASHTNSFGAGVHDVYLMKTTATGDTVWTRAYGTSSQDFQRDVDQTSDGGYVVVAHSDGFGAGLSDVYLIKTDGNGDTVWTRAYGGSLADYGYSVEQISDGNFIVAGYTSSFGAGGYDLYLLKIDQNGSALWAKTYGGPSSDVGYSVAETSDRGFVVAGYTASFGSGGDDMYLVRTDSLGGLLWAQTYGGSGSDLAWSVQETSDGGFVLGGQTSSFGAGGTDMFIVKTDRDGNSGCNESSTQTIEEVALTTVSFTATLVSGGAEVDTAVVGAGYPSTIESLLCKGPITSTSDENDQQPRQIMLHQNYPNPFNPETTFSYELASSGHVTLKVYDLLGREVGTVLDQVVAAGNHTTVWNASSFAGGVYLYRLKTAGLVLTRKLAIIK